MLLETHATSQKDFETAADNYRRAKAEVERSEQKARLLHAGDVTGQTFVLRSDLGPVVVVSSIDFATLRRAARASFDRPAAPPRAAASAKPSGTTFTDQMQQAVAEVWQDVLGVTNVGLADDFMDLGGHSLMAVGVATRLQRRFGSDLKLAALLEARTVRALAAVMRSRSAHTASG